MDREVLRQRLMSRCSATVDEAMKAVGAAPDGGWISGSEWQVRQAFQKLTSACFQELVQARVDTHPTAAAAVFFPGRGRAGAAGQGTAHGASVDGRR